MVFYDPRKPKPWPVRLLNKCGVTNDTTATHVVIVVSVVLLGITGYLLLDIDTTPESKQGPTIESLRNV